MILIIFRREYFGCIVSHLGDGEKQSNSMSENGQT